MRIIWRTGRHGPDYANTKAQADMLRRPARSPLPSFPPRVSRGRVEQRGQRLRGPAASRGSQPRPVTLESFWTSAEEAAANSVVLTCREKRLAGRHHNRTGELLPGRFPKHLETDKACLCARLPHFLSSVEFHTWERVGVRSSEGFLRPFCPQVGCHVKLWVRKGP